MRHVRFYVIRERDLRFFAVTRDAWKKYFVNIKKRDRKEGRLSESDRYLQAIIRDIAQFAEGAFDIITTPPSSGDGFNWAGAVAKLISTKSGVDYVTVFENHKHGKRYSVGQKLQGIKPEMKIKVTGQKILLFDDFCITRQTMYKTIKALESTKNVVMGLVIG